MKLKNNSQALSELSNHAINKNELLYFDGANWYVKVSSDCVVVYNTGDSQNITKQYMLGGQASRYILNNINNAKTNEQFINTIEIYRQAVQGIR